MKKLLIAMSSFLLLGATAGRPFQEGPAAVVLSVRGAVQVRLAGADPAAAAVGNRLAGGDQVIPAGGEAVIVHASGRTQRVTEMLTIEAAASGQQASTGTKILRVLASAAMTDARGNPNRQGMIRPIPGEPVLISPRNGLTVQWARPTFTWHAVDGATGYTIQIRRLDGGLERLEVSDTVWTVPSNAPALERGATYAWTVAPSSGRPTREQRFVVQGDEEYGQIAEELESLEAIGLDPLGDGLLMVAIVYMDAGLFYDASVALTALEDSGAPMSAEVFLLRGEILDSMGDLDAASAAFDEADRLMR